MNKRIRELIAQATTTEHGVDNGFDCVTFNKEKFAELIIQECANISNQAENQCQHPGTAIKKHFGVEL